MIPTDKDVAKSLTVDMFLRTNEPDHIRSVVFMVNKLEITPMSLKIKFIKPPAVYKWLTEPQYNLIQLEILEFCYKLKPGNYGDTPDELLYKYLEEPTPAKDYRWYTLIVYELINRDPEINIPTYTWDHIPHYTYVMDSITEIKVYCSSVRSLVKRKPQLLPELLPKILSTLKRTSFLGNKVMITDLLLEHYPIIDEWFDEHISEKFIYERLTTHMQKLEQSNPYKLYHELSELTESSLKFIQGSCGYSIDRDTLDYFNGL